MKVYKNNKAFTLVLYIFVHSVSFCFSSSGRFLYLSRPYCYFFSFSSLERLWYLSGAFSVVFPSYLDNGQLRDCYKRKKFIKTSIKNVIYWVIHKFCNSFYTLLNFNFIMIYIILLNYSSGLHKFTKLLELYEGDFTVGGISALR